MSQVDTGFEADTVDEMDVLMSQIDTEKMQPQYANALDEMDVLMCEIGTEKIQQDDNDIPGEILEGYVEAVSEINDEMVYQVQQEEDVEHDHDIP